MELFVKKAHHLSYQPSLAQGVHIGITTRRHGQSAYPMEAFNMARYIDDVPENITRHQEVLAEEIGFPRAQWVFPIQTHEARVVEITKADQGKNIDMLTQDTLYGIDAMFTYEFDTLLTMCYADCVPIYFYSPSHHFIALAHAGWRGTVARIVHRVLEQFPYDYQDLSVVIGPATSDSYEINEEIWHQFQSLPIDIRQYTVKRAPNRYGIDLKYANQLLCESYGVPRSNIYCTSYATSEDLELFFSYRVEKGQTGRMLAFIGQS
ncbi:peptidoglycan editing factor PgeF [Staphylococcus lutrae]|uniref:Purine nucleoside phosphorylase n=1 Tax=Staphylococcus lutrae TaxID=155085 RepID=A0AAC9RVE9_9STAP|nr:peptidoglycan editing factor PgeF [Staphylococcus lutrae]ARJ51612.1 laccase [Staphylococcus lutrae]PNZ36744.1 peptidoglycan editing factor PgeF [Staphylococcus lutrae]